MPFKTQLHSGSCCHYKCIQCHMRIVWVLCIMGKKIRDDILFLYIKINITIIPHQVHEQVA